MQSYRIQIRPLSAFGTSLLGDTLFGQLCWSIRNRQGEARLEGLLQDYTQGKPFLVVSNAFPADHIPMPDLPSSWFEAVPDTQRKHMKKRVWMPLSKVSEPLREWQRYSKSDKEAGWNIKESLTPHNSIDRRTGTTNDTGFAPYGMNQYWYARDTLLDIYLVLDESHVQPEEIETALNDMGSFGYGRDASIGLGKFEVVLFEATELPAQKNANASLTLAPCAPQGLGFDTTHSFYQLFTRFGRHGDLAVHQSGQPFKNPVLMARAGGVFVTESAVAWIGQGLGGEGRLSKSINNTVQQGYAPVIPLHLPQNQEQSA